MRQKDCGFIHSRPLGRRPESPPPQPAAPPGASSGETPRLRPLGVRLWPDGKLLFGSWFPPSHSEASLSFRALSLCQGSKKKEKNQEPALRRLPRGRLGLDLSLGASWTGYLGTPVIMLKILTKCQLLVIELLLRTRHCAKHFAYNTCKLHNNPREVAVVDIPIFSTRKLRHSEVESHMVRSIL